MSEGTKFIVEFTGEPLAEDVQRRIQERIQTSLLEELAQIATERGDPGVPRKVEEWAKLMERLSGRPIIGARIPTPRPWRR